jgi:hypothetical protein
MPDNFSNPISIHYSTSTFESFASKNKRVSSTKYKFKILGYSEVIGTPNKKPFFLCIVYYSM